MTLMNLMMASVPSWRRALRQNFTDLERLAEYLQLDADQRKKLLSRPKFALNLPSRLANKIVKGTLDDPILRQFVPLSEEILLTPGFASDAVGDQLCRKASKLLHKYEGRVLLVTTGACAMHCRYCFRQQFDYDIARKDFDDEIKIIAGDPSINEVILSGGDPLSLDNRVLEALIDRLSEIPHVKKLRFHTRFPVGIPERIDEDFLKILRETRLQVWFIVHINHVREIDEELLIAFRKLQLLGIPVLNQCVLLKDVNDTVEALYDLCNRLVDHGIHPYYLHQLDRVQGTAHFEVDEEKGKELINKIAERLPGYAVPRYVREIPGMPGKTPLTSYLQS